MSLVSEALRKARGEAARDSQRRGVVVVPVHVHSFGRGRSGRWVVPAVAIAAALAGAAIAWWTLRTQATTPAAPQTATHAAGAAAPLPAASMPPAPTAITAAAALPNVVKEVTKSAPAVQHPVPLPPREGASVVVTTRTSTDTTTVATRPAETVSQARDSEPARAASRAGTEGPVKHERTFVVDADLGYAKLHLDWLVYRPGSPFGKINGQDVVEGSVVEGFTVEEIRAEFVKLRDARGAVILRAH